MHDYTSSLAKPQDEIYSIAKPFGAGYKVGGLQLDMAGERLCVVSADGCFVYLYVLKDS